MIKKQTVGVLLTVVMCLAGCRNSTIEADTLTLSKDGTATYSIVSDFSEEYYNLEELMTMAQEEVDDYGSGVQITESVVEDGVLHFRYAFDSLLHYAEFMETTCFQGTVADAIKKGYQSDLQLTSAKADAAIFLKDETIQGFHIFVWTEDVAVKCNKSILYYSDNLTLNGRAGAVPKEGSEGPYYVVYK